ncbi:hypothetical protein DB347_14120 [Opitutaceae bacterium EW11]|nr:hypothetical protein DB347_14120 [Opitutaceae bacterium EW11]
MNKTDTHGFVNQLLVYTLVMICFSGSIGLGTVYLRQQMAQTANSIRQLDNRSEALERRLAETTAFAEAEMSPDVLKRRNAEWNIGMVPPQEQQIVRVTEPVEDRLAQKHYQEMFAKEQPAAVQVKFVLGGGGD